MHQTGSTDQSTLTTTTDRALPGSDNDDNITGINADDCNMVATLSLIDHTTFPLLDTMDPMNNLGQVPYVHPMTSSTSIPVQMSNDYDDDDGDDDDADIVTATHLPSPNP